jgi:signal transduction histidine kinase/ligand-binding sensor domain-containing protein
MRGNISYSEGVIMGWFVRLILLMLCPFLLRGQPVALPQSRAQESFAFEHYGQTEGLSQGTIYAMASYDGYMWFGTQDGLNRFDGVQFQVFRKGGRHSLNGNLVQALLADSHGKLWIGSGNGLNLYDRTSGLMHTFQDVFGLSHALGRTSINRLVEDRQQRIWIITDALGLFCFDPRTKSIRSFFPNDNTIISLTVAPDGSIWAASLNEVFRYDAATRAFRPMQIRQQLRSQSLIRSILVDKQNNLWVATSDDGVFVLDKDDVAHYRQGPTTQDLSSNEVTSLLADRDGRVWIGTRTGGLCLFHPDTRRFSYVRHSATNNRSLTENFVWQLAQDQQGIIWVGSSSQGIDKYDPRGSLFGLIRRTADSDQPSLPDNMIFRLFGQGDDLYIGTETGGVVRYSIKTSQVTPFARTLAPPVEAMQNETRVITADSGRRLWFANWRELVQYDPVSHRLNRYPAVGPHKQLYAYAAHVLTDTAGRSTEVWVGGQGGLTRFDVTRNRWMTWQDIPALQAIANYSIRLIYQHTPGMIWLGTLRTGLIGYDRASRQTVSFNEENGLPCANIRSLLQLGPALWVGTDCGLFRIDLPTRRVVRHYTKADGLPNDVIYGILADERGNLWLSSNQGLTLFSPRRGVLKNYDVTDGLQSNEFNTNVSYKHTDGTLFFGGTNGITYFRPERFSTNTFVPPVHITAVTVLDSAYNPAQPLISLGPTQNFITIEFAALNFSNSRKNQYRYQLEGIDPGWVQAGHNRTANYTKLPPGAYVFRVKGSNDDGIWNERGASMRILIRPPYWATWWFRLLLISLLLAGLYGVYRYRIAQLQSRQAHELAVSIRTQEFERQRFAKELHDGVGANLAVLTMYLSALGSPNTPIPELKRRSLAVLKSSIADIRSIIHDMHPRSLSEQGLVETITDTVALLNESNQVVVVFEALNVPNPLPEPVEINLFRVVQELLQNAIKHAHASQVWLTLQHESNTLHLTYRDNGSGFAPTPADRPLGNGLVNINQRIALLKGSCVFDSATGQGVTVTIAVPVTP